MFCCRRPHFELGNNSNLWNLRESVQSQELGLGSIDFILLVDQRFYSILIRNDDDSVCEWDLSLWIFHLVNDMLYLLNAVVTGIISECYSLVHRSAERAGNFWTKQWRRSVDLSCTYHGLVLCSRHCISKSQFFRDSYTLDAVALVFSRLQSNTNTYRFCQF